VITSHELFEIGPESALSQLDGMDFNQLLLVVEIASMEMRSRLELSDPERIAWENLAFRTVEVMQQIPVSLPHDLPEIERTAHAQGRRLREEMGLRAALIAKFGPVAERGHRRDPEALVDWFLGVVGNTTPTESVAATAAAFREGDLQRIWALRQLKNQLNLLQSLDDKNRLTVAPPRDEVVRGWLEVRSQLP
jgi:hypothetical protein